MDIKEINTTRDVLNDLILYLDNADFLLKSRKSTSNHVTYYLAGNSGNHHTYGELVMDINLSITGNGVTINTDSPYIKSVYDEIAKVCTMTIPVCPKGVNRIYDTEEPLRFRPGVELLEPERAGQVILRGHPLSLIDAYKTIKGRYSRLGLEKDPRHYMNCVLKHI